MREKREREEKYFLDISKKPKLKHVFMFFHLLFISNFFFAMLLIYFDTKLILMHMCVRLFFFVLLFFFCFLIKILNNMSRQKKIYLLYSGLNLILCAFCFMPLFEKKKFFYINFFDFEKTYPHFNSSTQN